MIDQSQIVVQQMVNRLFRDVGENVLKLLAGESIKEEAREFLKEFAEACQHDPKVAHENAMAQEMSILFGGTVPPANDIPDLPSVEISCGDKDKTEGE